MTKVLPVLPDNIRGRDRSMLDAALHLMESAVDAHEGRADYRNVAIRALLRSCGVQERHILGALADAVVKTADARRLARARGQG